MYAFCLLALFGVWLGWEFKSVMKLALTETPETFEAEELKPCA